MKRRLEAALSTWSKHPGRKPLVLRGARQVGKSWLVREWGARRYGPVIELNLERDPHLGSCFKGNDPRATLRRLEAYTGRIISPDGSALLFLDEIQASPEVLAKLRWFAEELPRLPVIAAGSLLDFALADHSFSMPVGRIAYLHLEPLGFEEFLDALGEQPLARALAELEVKQVRRDPDPFPEALHQKAVALFREYLLVGGMPAAVAQYRTARSLPAIGQVHRDLLATIRDDFAKYADRVHHRRLTAVFDSVPQQLGGKFSFARVDRSERAAALARAVELLCLARVCHRVQASPAVRVPVAAGAEARSFKLLLLDVGLVSAALGLTLEDLEGADLTLANQGAVAEQVVGQLLRLNFAAGQSAGLHYWRRAERGSEAEVDYVVQHGAALVPIEVKAGATGSLKSLHVLMAERKWARAVRFNADLPSLVEVRVKTRPGAAANYELLSLPLYLVEQLPRLLSSWR